MYTNIIYNRAGLVVASVVPLRHNIGHVTKTTGSASACTGSCLEQPDPRSKLCGANIRSGGTASLKLWRF